MKTFEFKACLGVLLAAAIAISTGCNISLVMDGGYSFTKQGVTAESTEEGDFSPDIHQIRVENLHGNVKVELATGEPGWTWNKKVWSDTQEMADILLDELQVEIETIDGTQSWVVVLPEPGADLNGVESNLTMHVPAGVDVDVNNRHGDLEVANLDSQAKLENAHGNVRLNRLSNNVSAVNHHGDLSATDLMAATFNVRHGDANIENVAGDLTFEQGHGDTEIKSVEGRLKYIGSHSDCIVSNAQDVEIATTFGKLKMNEVMGDAILKNAHGNIQGNVEGNLTASNQHGDVDVNSGGDRINVTSFHGDVDVTVLNGSFESIEIKTTFDDIDLKLPSTSTPSVNMSTSHGDARSEFDAAKGSDQKVILKNSHGDITVRKHSN